MVLERSWGSLETKCKHLLVKNWCCYCWGVLWNLWLLSYQIGDRFRNWPVPALKQIPLWPFRVVYVCACACACVYVYTSFLRGGGEPWMGLLKIHVPLCFLLSLGLQFGLWALSLLGPGKSTWQFSQRQGRTYLSVSTDNDLVDTDLRMEVNSFGIALILPSHLKK